MKLSRPWRSHRSPDDQPAQPAAGRLPDLIALTDNDPLWTWDACLGCGSPKVSHRALWIRRRETGEWEVSRVAWCGDEPCQADREISDGLVYVNDRDEQGGGEPA